MEKENKTFEVSVSENMGLGELSPGGVTQPKKEEPKQTREEIIQKVLERKVELAQQYVEPHDKKSRKVLEEDVKFVIEKAKILHEMCLVGRGIYTTAFALHHSQIENKDPLNFFVTINGKIMVNPKIINHVNYLIDKKEGCMSFPEEPMTTIERFHKVVLEYQTLVFKEKDGKAITEPTLSKVITTNYSGQEAEIAQHELEHALGHNIYEKNHDPDWCLGLNKK